MRLERSWRMPLRMMHIMAKATMDTISVSLLDIQPRAAKSPGEAGVACPLELAGAAAPAEITSMSCTGISISEWRAMKASPLRTAWGPQPPPCSFLRELSAALRSSPLDTHNRKTERFAGSAGRGGGVGCESRAGNPRYRRHATMTRKHLQSANSLALKARSDGGLCRGGFGNA